MLISRFQNFCEDLFPPIKNIKMIKEFLKLKDPSYLPKLSHVLVR